MSEIANASKCKPNSSLSFAGTSLILSLSLSIAVARCFPSLRTCHAALKKRKEKHDEKSPHLFAREMRTSWDVRRTFNM